jgi:signal peptidase I
MRILLNWGLFIAVLTGVWWFAGPAHLGGPANYVIVDGRSMEPTYDSGDLVITRERDRYGVGDVIVYDAPIDTQFEVIHRIVEPTEGGFVTQGDNRDEPDGWIAPHETIRGAALFHIPNGGAIVAFLRQPAAILALLAGFISFEALKRSERKRDDEQDEERDDGPDGPPASPCTPSSQNQAGDSRTPWVAGTSATHRSARRSAWGRQRPMLLQPAAVLGTLLGLVIAERTRLSIAASEAAAARIPS